MKYQVTIKSNGVKMLFKYNKNNVLIGFFIQGGVEEKSIPYLQQNMPWRLADLDSFKKDKDYIVDQVVADLSFNAFWNNYSHKVGNKKRAERLWKLLSENDKAKAMSYIKRYDNYLIQNQGISKVYPETYLNQRRFDNE